MSPWSIVLDKEFEQVSPKQWSTMLDKIQLSDAGQLEVAAVVSAKMSNAPDEEKKAVNGSLVPKSKGGHNFTRSIQDQLAFDRIMQTWDSVDKLLSLNGWQPVEKSRLLLKRFVSTIITTNGIYQALFFDISRKSQV